MASKSKEPEHAGLYLVSPPLADAVSFALQLEAALDAGDVACVLADVANADPAGAKKIARTLAPIAQERGAALLITGDTRLVARSGADGAHLKGAGDAFIASIAEAAGDLKPDYIIGVSGLRTRHDCMSAGELEVDYILFDEPAKDGWIPPLDERLQRVSWWSEIFNLPCVAFAARLDEVEALAKAGADFVALGDAVWSDPRGPASAVRDAAAALRKVVRPA